MGDGGERPLSDLEWAALGHVWAFGPCTAHAVRTGFRRSPSTHWSGSAGSVYPLLERLERRGLLAVEVASWGSRQRRLLSVSAEGEKSLANWLRAGVDDEAAAAVFDGVRTRSFFLGVLPVAERIDFVRSARAGLERHLERIERDIEARRAAGDRFAVLGARGAWHTARARLEWIDEVERELSEDE